MSEELAGKSVAASSLTTTTLMTPELANFSGNIHGGHILRLVDQIAYACASQYSGRYCVTVSVDRVQFRVPVKVGDLLTMYAQVNYVGRSSMEIGVRVEAHDLRGGEVRHTNSCFLTMVAMEEGHSVPVPPLILETEDDRRRHRKARLRRDQHRAMQRIVQSEEQYHSIVALAAIATLLIDHETGAIRYANPAACALLKREAQDLEGRSVWSLHPPERQGAARALWKAVVETGHAEAPSLEHMLRDGEIRPFSVTSWLIPLPGGPLIQRVLRPVSAPAC